MVQQYILIYRSKYRVLRKNNSNLRTFEPNIISVEDRTNGFHYHVKNDNPIFILITDLDSLQNLLCFETRIISVHLIFYLNIWVE